MPKFKIDDNALMDVDALKSEISDPIQLRTLDRIASEIKRLQEFASRSNATIGKISPALAALQAILAYEHNRPGNGTRGAEVYALAKAAVAEHRRTSFLEEKNHG